MSAVFHGARLKVKRADVHIRDLQRLLDGFRKSDFYTLGVEEDEEGHAANIVFEADVVPEESALLLGDAIHNLRASLDLMYHELIELVGGTPRRYSSFPIGRDSRKNLESALLDGPIKTAGSIIEVLLDTIKPYKGGNDALVALHAMDVADKHILILPVVHLVGITVDAESRSGQSTISNARIEVEPIAGKFYAITGPSDLKITKYGQPAVEIFFGEGQPLGGQPIFPTLMQLSQLVSRTIEHVKDAFEASRS